MGKKIFYLAVVIIFAIIAGIPLLHSGLHPTHDGEYHVVRFYEFDKTLRDGNLYPRWAADFNNKYGIPLFNYVYPFPNYTGSFLHGLGLSFINSFKISMFIATIIGAIFFYLWAKRFWGELGGVVSSIFYTYSPYHFVDVYVRGSIGEVWSLAFFPGLLWATTSAIQEQKRSLFLISSIFLALVIFSHNILALMFFFLFLIYCSFFILNQPHKKFLVRNLAITMIVGLGLSAIFWIPAIIETRYVQGLQIYDVVTQYPELYQLLFPSWGTGFLGQSLDRQMSYQIGVANLMAILLSMFSLVILVKRKERLRAILVGLMNVLFFLTFFLMLNYSEGVWKVVPLLNYFQFPWRLLSVEILISSFLAGSIIYVISNRLRFVKYIFVVILILISFSLTISYTKPAYYHMRSDSHYLTRSNFMDGTNSPGNAFNTQWMNTSRKVNKKMETIKGKTQISNQLISSQSYKANIRVQTNSVIQINTAYFPGWTVYANNTKIPLQKTSTGLMSFNLQKGTYNVEIVLKNTNIRVIATLISIFSFITLSILFAKEAYATMKR